MDHNVQYVTISRRRISRGGGELALKYGIYFVQQFQKFFTRGIGNRTVQKLMFSIQITWFFFGSLRTQ
jgi:hypothetical protein